MQVHLFEFAPDDLRATFSSANGMAIRIAQTMSPFIAGLFVASVGFNTLYLAAAAISIAMAVLAVFSSSLKFYGKDGI